MRTTIPGRLGGRPGYMKGRGELGEWASYGELLVQLDANILAVKGMREKHNGDGIGDAHARELYSDQVFALLRERAYLLERMIDDDAD